MLYMDLFLTFCMIGVMTYGGGYSALPLIESSVVQGKQWLTPAELADVISISEVSPGPFSLNCSTFVGMKTAGWPGAIITTAGFLFLPAVIVLIMAVLLSRYSRSPKVRTVLNVLNACIIAVLMNTAIHLFTNAVGPIPGMDPAALTIFLVAFILLFRFKVNPLIVMAVSGIIGAILHPA